MCWQRVPLYGSFLKRSLNHSAFNRSHYCRRSAATAGRRTFDGDEQRRAAWPTKWPYIISSSTYRAPTDSEHELPPSENRRDAKKIARESDRLQNVVQRHSTFQAPYHALDETDPSPTDHRPTSSIYHRQRLFACYNRDFHARYLTISFHGFFVVFFCNYKSAHGRYYGHSSSRATLMCK